MIYPIFKIPFSRYSKVPNKKLIFILGKLYQNFFLFYPLITLLIFHIKYGLIWTTPSPDEKELFLNFAKIRNSRISQNSVWKPNIFLRQAIPKTLFALHFHYTGGTPHRVWFDFDNSFTRWKRIISKFRKKFAIRETRKIPYENPIISLGQL